eukprot:TRINITY_DN43899_c0_g1_i1.p1 TRINITY_DN43899_c0_g1~~TRINITY_DN43899_c0_g1_i1.p1  ORF type:complete len:196 (-),score=31.69 TRINITY_DN43899_c0_g1_i1:218-805(-)
MMHRLLLSTSLTTCLCLVSAIRLIIDDDMEKVLERHNVYRCMHDVGALEWDDELAKSAQKWADNGKFEHAQDRQLDGADFGENLAWGAPSQTGSEAVKSWYDEVEKSDGGKIESFSKETGHYTQLVWKVTKKVGCGRAKSTQGGQREGDFWVCRYLPAGNVEGQFADNVLEAKKSENTCGSSSNSGSEGENDGDN